MTSVVYEVLERARRLAVILGLAGAALGLPASASGFPLTEGQCLFAATCGSVRLVTNFLGGGSVASQNAIMSVDGIAGPSQVIDDRALYESDTRSGFEASMVHDAMVGPLSVPLPFLPPPGVFTQSAEAQATAFGAVGAGCSVTPIKCGFVSGSVRLGASGTLSPPELASFPFPLGVAVRGTVEVTWSDTLTVMPGAVPRVLPFLPGFFTVSPFLRVDSINGSEPFVVTPAKLDFTVVQTDGKTGDVKDVQEQVFTLRFGGDVFATDTLFFSVALGDTLSIRSDLVLDGAIGSAPNRIDFVDISALGSGGFFVDPQTPDFSYITASGFAYFSPAASPPGPGPEPPGVPHPATLLLVSLGVVAMSIARVGRRGEGQGQT